LISDTHDNLTMIDRAINLFREENVEYVVHAGDWVAPFSARRFEEFRGRLAGSYGNNDGELIGLSRAFREMNMDVRGEFTEFEIQGEHLAVMHGTHPQVVRAVAASGKFPVVIYGHSHIPLIEHIGDVLLVNPGEACGYLYGRSTVGILDTRKWDAEILELS